MTPDPHSGLVLHGHVHVGERLRGDGTVSVFSAHDTDTDRPVTVTLLDPRVAAEPAHAQAFLDRARDLAGLDTPGLNRVLRQGRDGDHVAMVSEHVPGENIAARLEGGERGLRYSPHAALAVVIDVLTALNEAHDQGVVHGGLGPRGVVLGEDGRATVTGFRMIDVDGITPRTDVHAVGSLLHALVTGALRIDGDTVPRPSALVPDLPPELDTLVETATHNDPRQRPRDAGQYLGMVEQVLRSLPGPDGDTGPDTLPIPVVGAAEAPAAPRPTPLWRRTPIVATAGVLALALLVTGWVLVRDDAVALPDLTGYSQERAETELAALELGLGSSFDDAYSDDVEPGGVAETDPAAGTELREGDTILLSLSIGPRHVTIPDVEGEPESEARTLLREAGFTRVTVVQEYSADHDPGTVLSTTPEVGEDGDREEEVTLHVSEGVLVPTLTGMGRDEATTALEGLGLTATVVEAHSDSVPEGQIGGQDPEPGTILPEDGGVTLTVSLGPEEIEEAEEVDPDPRDDEGEDEVEETVSCSGDAWDPRTTYDAGDRVHFEGREYEARWWIQGLPPGIAAEWSAWSDQGAC
ncbi:PASTA domain-containing protein [Nocardiopsis sp. MG754419]|uniref:PASTA domain-containing protein n=1 Tax=Nocardiopsis sp. MG754419 TaxID=2259865 RepID=UPI001BAD5405|nr:PASTA domain-containing protein [Nocardiopsis sp. MG754419]MBR8743832.1 serine/threonine protein kinase [Nocardiopsis sp. MG754419]